MINKEEILKKISFYDKLLLKKPNDKKPMKGKIAVYREVEDYNEMLNTCNTALKIYPQELSICLSKGVALLKLGKKDEAKNILEFINSNLSTYVYDDDMAKLAFAKEYEQLSNEFGTNSDVENINQNDNANNENNNVNEINVEHSQEHGSNDLTNVKYVNKNKTSNQKDETKDHNEKIEKNVNINEVSMSNKQTSSKGVNQVTQNEDSNKNHHNHVNINSIEPHVSVDESLKQLLHKLEKEHFKFEEDEILELLKSHKIEETDEINEILKDIKRKSRLSSKESFALISSNYDKLYKITEMKEFLVYGLYTYNKLIDLGNPQFEFYFRRGEIHFLLNDLESAKEDYKSGTKMSKQLIKADVLDQFYFENMRSELRKMLLSKGEILDDVIDLKYLKPKNKSENQISSNNNNDNQDGEANRNSQLDEVLSKFAHYEEKFLKMEARISELELIVKKQDEVIKTLKKK